MYVNENNHKRINFRMVFQGMVIGFLLLLLITSFMAVIFSLFDFVSFDIISTILLIFNFLIITFIGFYIAQNVNRNGWLNGGLGGSIYMGVLIFLTYFSNPLSWGTVILLLILGLIVGSIGGILGINF